MTRRTRRIVAGVLALMAVAVPRALAAEAPAGQMTWALHFSLAPTLFEPAETAGLITPFMILYALHDALVKPMPEKAMAPSLAESWSTSPDGLVHEFVLRNGARFHNGEPVTADDVKFSFERYRGISAKVATRIEPFAVSSGAYAYGGYPRHRRALQGPGGRARPEAARGDAPSDPAAHSRKGHGPPDLAARHPAGGRSARGGTGVRPHRGLPVVGAVRGPEAQGEVRRAEDYATADILTKGRIVFGVGRGYR